MKKQEIINKIIEIHKDDNEQMEFIFSKENRIIVTAPAGCGKTKSMISKISYEITNGSYFNFKKILALTFSVNAATKIKIDIMDTLPEILEKPEGFVSKKLDVANYHSFSMRLIKKHGYFFDPILLELETFKIISEDDSYLEGFIEANEIELLKNFSERVNKKKIKGIEGIEKKYIEILLEKLVVQKIITYNGLLILGNLLLQNEKIKSYYLKYYQLIIVDEFQDTNYLSYKLITSLIGKNKIILMGDNIQKIYGFLGAHYGIFEHMKNQYKMTVIKLKTNYRFKENKKMKLLDSYLRELFNSYDNFINEEMSAEIKLKTSNTLKEESQFIVNHMVDESKKNFSKAFLVRANYMADSIIEILEERNIDYFNGLFSDSTFEYITFHKVALEIFIKESGVRNSTSKKTRANILKKLEENRNKIISDPKDENIFSSLLRLLNALFESLDKNFTNKQNKYDNIVFVLSNNGLKRLMNEIKDKIILTTIHGSKGLEWDYVYIPEIISGKFPLWRGMCEKCKNLNGRKEYSKKCEFMFLKELENNFKEELSVFYVAVTRAKKDVFLFYNTGNNSFGYPNIQSCFLNLPGLETIDIN